MYIIKVKQKYIHTSLWTWDLRNKSLCFSYNGIGKCEKSGMLHYFSMQCIKIMQKTIIFHLDVLQFHHNINKNEDIWLSSDAIFPVEILNKL